MPTALPRRHYVPPGRWRPGAWNTCKLCYGATVAVISLGLTWSPLGFLVMGHALRVLDRVWEETE